MSKQPGYQSSGYKLFKAGFAAMGALHRGRLSEWPEDERRAVYDAYRAGWEELQDEIADARQNGKQALIKEHSIFLQGPDKMFASVYDGDKLEPIILQQRDEPESAYTNPTSLPDSFLLSMQPIFQIRHPAMMFPSMVRASNNTMEDTNLADPGFMFMLTLRYSRALYDWYSEHTGKRKPRVIDADDVMNDPETVRQLCIETGLDPDAVQYEWEERHEPDPVKAVFLSTIYSSKGIVKGRDARNLDIEAEKVKWKAEFGDDTAEVLAQFVYDAMPDYEYLRSRRTRSNITT
ncbi:hypothetical protein GQ44DRAFT_743150 [Phaeosphaeriaceae sp. PMI808]|nr:hypothetical protein GQ44DRAFT_743150 [Phaeosphaeriaceae sp. PMI808]